MQGFVNIFLFSFLWINVLASLLLISPVMSGFEPKERLKQPGAVLT